MGVTAVVPATDTVSVVKGTFSIQQNGILDLFSNGEAKFKAYIMSSKDLTGMNIKLWVGEGADCATALAATLASTTHTEIAMVNVPPSINGFYVSGATKGMAIEVPNPNPNNLKSLKSTATVDKFLIITDPSGAIGCSKAKLA